MGKVVTCDECRKTYRNLEDLEDLRENDSVCLHCNYPIEVEDWDRLLASYDQDEDLDDLDEDFDEDLDEDLDEDFEDDDLGELDRTVLADGGLDIDGDEDDFSAIDDEDD